MARPVPATPPVAGLAPLGVAKRRPALAETVARHLRQAIASGTFRPEEKLPPEAALAASFAVSRPVIREAIAQLRVDGLVRSRQGVGVFVSDSGAVRRFGIDAGEMADPRALAQIYQLRMMVEIGAAGLAARNRKRKALKAMHRALAGIAAAIAEGTDGVEPDIAFHLSIAEASGNDYLAQFLGMLSGALRESIAVARGNTRRGGAAAELAVQAQHEAILEAIEAGDAAAAEAAMGAHLRYTADQLGLRI
jgi:GntR family transcriptional repressor for pyruvate dehydrogenase complex